MISMTGTSIIITIAFIVLSIIGVISAMKWIYAYKSSRKLAEESQNLVPERNKFDAVNVFKLQGTFFNFGLVLSLAMTVMAFNWTQYEKAYFIPDASTLDMEDIDVIPPRTIDQPPPPPVLPPPLIEEVPEEDILEKDEVEFVSLDVDETTEIVAPPVVKKEPLPLAPPVIEEPEPTADEIFKFVEEMPRFPGCEDQGSIAEKKACADKMMLQFIYKNIKYPAIARENGIDGTCVIQFVVDKNGHIINAKAVRDIGGQCGQEALRVVNLMNETGMAWTPGKQRGRAVNVLFNLPIKFRLE